MEKLVWIFRFLDRLNLKRSWTEIWLEASLKIWLSFEIQH